MDIKKDLTVDIAKGRLNIRVAGWIEKDNMLLVSTFPDGTISLPGGRVQFGETSLEGIKREILEEAGVPFLNAELFAVIENFFQINVPYHELLFIYKGTIEEQQSYNNGDDDNQILSWIPMEEVKNLKPHALQKLSGKKHDSQIIHIINID